jgi:trehalose-6-phosphatase
LEWLKSLEADFILAIGDDWTDEDLFRSLPSTAYSVRVGLANTAARYYLGNHTAVRRVLRELSQVTGENRAGPPASGGPFRAGAGLSAKAHVS